MEHTERLQGTGDRHCGRLEWDRKRSSRAQVLNAVAQSLLQAHDDGHLDEQVHHAATEMALWGQHEGQGWSMREEGNSRNGQ